MKHTRLLLGLCLAAVTTACRGDARGPTPGAADTTAAPTDAAARSTPTAAAPTTVGADTSAARPTATALAPPRTSGGFPHTPHREVACRTCHGSIQGHATHTAVPCRECHAALPTSGVTRVLTREECLGCHHARAQAVPCVTCHTPVPPGTVQRTLEMGVWAGPRTISLPFDHARHGSLQCAACHTDPPLLKPERACGSCHLPHHRPDADCASCHAAPPASAHDDRVHGGCSAATGCHADSVAKDLPMNRPTCLVCHRDRVDHQPGRECAPCHRLVSAPGKDR